jgi:L-ribulose-5-phosphate 3-epimerase
MSASDQNRVPRFGVMQGRLSPKYRNRYQAHPVGYWHQEFSLASDLGLDCIEFILDFEGADNNPLLCEGGTEEILEAAGESGVGVSTVCADYFMEAPLHHPDDAVSDQSEQILRRLVDNGKTLGLRDIVVPCVDQSSILDPEMAGRFVERVARVMDAFVAAEMNLCLESDLAPQPFAELLTRINSERVTVNYDTGNSAALGYDPREELACYGDRITDVHIKDRTLGGGSVVLGTGDTKFGRFFEALQQTDFSGPFIMQAFRDDEGVGVFRSQLEWIKPHLSPWFQT